MTVLALPFRAAALCGLVLLGGQPGLAQTPAGSTTEGLHMNRAQLDSLRQELEAAAASPAYSARVSERALREASFIAERLSQGDMRVGDRVLLDVEGEETLPDTLAVERGPSVDLPTYGRISLEGVLRSELEDHFTTEIGRFIRDPVVRAQALIRVSIQGPGIGAPGFYTLPAQMLVGEALMQAGGPLGESDLEGIEVRRGDLLLWSGIETRDAIVNGQTLDQMNLRGGDEIRVPVRPPNQWWNIALQYGLPIAISLVLGAGVLGGGF